MVAVMGISVSVGFSTVDQSSSSLNPRDNLIPLYEFLERVSEAFDKYYEANGCYPREWRQVEIYYSGVPDKLGEVHREYPRKEDPHSPNVWNPEGSHLYFIISQATSSSKNSFLIIIKDEWARETYQFRKGDRANYENGQFWISHENDLGNDPPKTKLDKNLREKLLVFLFQELRYIERFSSFFEGPEDLTEKVLRFLEIGENNELDPPLIFEGILKSGIIKNNNIFVWNNCLAPDGGAEIKLVYSLKGDDIYKLTQPKLWWNDLNERVVIQNFNRLIHSENLGDINEVMAQKILELFLQVANIDNGRYRILDSYKDIELARDKKTSEEIQLSEEVKNQIQPLKIENTETGYEAIFFTWSGVGSILQEWKVTISKVGNVNLELISSQENIGAEYFIW